MIYFDMGIKKSNIKMLSHDNDMTHMVYNALEFEYWDNKDSFCVVIVI